MDLRVFDYPLKIAVILFLIIFLGGMEPRFTFGEDDGQLEEILEGFDEPNNTEADMENVLEGFDEAGEEDRNSGDAGENDDAILEGFDDENASAGNDAGPTSSAGSYFSIDGYLKFGSTYNFLHDKPGDNEIDWRGFSKLRSELLLQAELKPNTKWNLLVSGKGHYDAAYAVNGRDEYPKAFLDDYETELEWRDTYISGSLLDNLDIRMGRQIVVWGKSDNIRITDVLNPIDLREPGLTDIEDLRLPVCMSKADYYFGDFSLSGIAVHEIRFNKLPQMGSDFFPSPSPLPSEEKPAPTLGHTEYALALNGIFSGWDMALYWTDMYNDTARIRTVASQEPSSMRRTHDRMNMLGGSINIARGNFLFKSEAAYFRGLRFYRADDVFSRIDALIGLEYAGFPETTISFELADRHLLNFKQELETAPDNAEEDEYQSAIRLTREFMHDTMTLTMLLNFFGLSGEDGAFQRLTLDYAVTDALNVLGGVVFYQAGDMLERVEENDRLILEAKYFF